MSYIKVILDIVEKRSFEIIEEERWEIKQRNFLKRTAYR